MKDKTGVCDGNKNIHDHANVIPLPYHDVICERCERKIGESLDAPTSAVCIDCYQTK